MPSSSPSFSGRSASFLSSATCKLEDDDAEDIDDDDNNDEDDNDDDDNNDEDDNDEDNNVAGDKAAAADDIDNDVGD